MGAARTTGIHYPQHRPTPLHLAAECDAEAVVRLLVEAGADPKARNEGWAAIVFDFATLPNNQLV